MTEAAEMALKFYREVEELRADKARLTRDIMIFRQSIAALIEVYAPAERKELLRREHLGHR